MRMRQYTLKPFFVAWLEIEIDDGSEAEGEESARNLITIRRPQFRMSIDRVVIQRAGVAYVHVRIDQTRDQKSSAAVYSLRLRAGNQIRSYFGDLSIFDEDIDVMDWQGTFWRNHCDILDDGVVSTAYLRLCRG